MNYNFHTCSKPHQDDLLNMSTAFEGLTIGSRFNEAGHVHWIGQHILQTCVHNLNKDNVPVSIPAMQAVVVPVNNPQVIPQLLYRCLLASEKQMHLQLLDGFYKVSRVNRPQWPGGPKGKNLPWTTMKWTETLALIHSAVIEWQEAYNLLALQFLKDQMFKTKVSIPQYAKHMMPLLTELVAAGRKKHNPAMLRAILDFFPKFTKLISDVAYVLKETPSLGLDILATLPSRRDVLYDIWEEASVEQELTATALLTVLKLPKDKRTCSICLHSWFDDIDEATLKVYDTAGKEDKNVAWVKHNKTALQIREGYEGVPIQMQCGHVFCAGCIKTWLDSPGRLQCPYRDQEYGVHRSPAVRVAEKLKIEYYHSNVPWAEHHTPVSTEKQ